MMDAVNLKQLDRYTGGDKRMNRDVLSLFETQITALVSELGAGIASDPKRWREIAHSIKGAARGVGAFALGEAAARAEDLDPADGPEAKIMVENLEGEAAAVRGFIRAYLAG